MRSRRAPLPHLVYARVLRRCLRSRFGRLAFLRWACFACLISTTSWLMCWGHSSSKSKPSSKTYEDIGFFSYDSLETASCSGSSRRRLRKRDTPRPPCLPRSATRFYKNPVYPVLVDWLGRASEANPGAASRDHFTRSLNRAWRWALGAGARLSSANPPPLGSWVNWLFLALRTDLVVSPGLGDGRTPAAQANEGVSERGGMPPSASTSILPS